jgi:hypothetical protein
MFIVLMGNPPLAKFAKLYTLGFSSLVSKKCRNH